MTEFDIQTRLFNAFKTLNTVSGKSYLKTDSSGNYTNVHFPNVPFTVPEDKRYFELYFKNNETEDTALTGELERCTGILYIDIITQQDVGEDEAKNKYKWIAKLFNEVNIDVVDIMKVYISTKGNEADHYRLQVAVVWEADIEKE